MKSEITREYILRKAYELFSHFGFYKTAMDDIATEARVGKGTIYYYFKSKYELFAEVLQRDSLRILEKVKESISGVPVSRDRILKVFLLHLKEMRDSAILRQTLSDDKLMEIPDIRKSVEKVRETFYSFFREICREDFGGEKTCRISQIISDLITILALSPSYIFNEIGDEKSTELFRSILKGVAQNE